eukprot:scaffold137530_cov20-Prasinocladus_malaysianus.AAC.1
MCNPSTATSTATAARRHLSCYDTYNACSPDETGSHFSPITPCDVATHAIADNISTCCSSLT